MHRWLHASFLLSRSIANKIIVLRDKNINRLHLKLHFHALIILITHHE